MWDKADAAAQLTEEKLPLFTSDIAKTLAEINKGPPNPSAAAVLELIKRHPDHFADLILRRTKGHSVEGQAIWIDPDTDHEFHDIDVEIVSRYLGAALSLQDRFMQLPHARFMARYKQFLERKRTRDLRRAHYEDEERFFSFPTAMASDECWDHWRKLPYLTADECTALALGRNPGVVSLAKIEEAVGSGLSAFLDEYRRTKQIFDRHQAGKGLGEGLISLADFRRWLKEADIETPLDAATGSRRLVSPEATDAKEFSKPAVHSLYRLLFAFALRQHPDLIDRMKLNVLSEKDPKGSIFVQIEKELNPIFGTINDGNVKTYLRRAQSYVRSEGLLDPPEKTASVGKIPKDPSSSQK